MGFAKIVRMSAGTLEGAALPAATSVVNVEAVIAQAKSVFVREKPRKALMVHHL
jgi:hypothetical protein